MPNKKAESNVGDRTTTETKDSLEASLTKWLGEQGYPLEMEVAQEFRASKFIVAQSTYYSDPETGEAREIDVLAVMAGQNSDMEIRLVCLVECKVPDKPWVIFSSSRDKGDGQSDYVGYVGSDLGLNNLKHLYWQKYFPLPLALAFRDRLGYGITQAFRNSQQKVDPAYTAVMQASKAAIARAALVDSLVQTDPTPDPIVEVVIPVVVVDTKLFEYYLEADGSKLLRTFHWGALSFGNPIAGRSESTLVQIVTKEGLPDFVRSMTELFGHLLSVAKERHDSLQTRWTYILRRAGKGPPGAAEALTTVR